MSSEIDFYILANGLKTQSPTICGCKHFGISCSESNRKSVFILIYYKIATNLLALLVFVFCWILFLTVFVKCHR